MKAIFYTLLILMFGLTVSCDTTKKLDVSADETELKELPIGREIISAPIVFKPFVNKAGKNIGFDEVYVQRSIQDYFVKFCEGNVSKEEIEKALAKQTGMIKTLKMEVAIKEGTWDICPEDNENMQSRIGSYIVIYKIID